MPPSANSIDSFSSTARRRRWKKALHNLKIWKSNPNKKRDVNFETVYSKREYHSPESSDSSTDSWAWAWKTGNTWSEFRSYRVKKFETKIRRYKTFIAKRTLTVFWPDRNRKFENPQNLFTIPKSMFTAKTATGHFQQVTRTNTKF